VLTLLLLAPASAGRLVAVGDLHGDLDNALAVLQLAGVVDTEGHWSGGTTTLVQTGDVTDRGPDSRELIELLAVLEREAAEAGGEVVALLGNHEVMNLMGDLRYVHPGDTAKFGTAEARAAAFSSEGALGQRLRTLGVVAIEDDIVFCHGGIAPTYAAMGIDDLNAMAAGVVAGQVPPSALGQQSPIWYRGYLLDPEVEACATLDEALAALGAERMVVGHTTQRSGQLAVRCGGRLIGVDIGIADHYGAHLGVLEVVDGDARALYPAGWVDLPDPPKGATP